MWMRTLRSQNRCAASAARSPPPPDHHGEPERATTFDCRSRFVFCCSVAGIPSVCIGFLLQELTLSRIPSVCCQHSTARHLPHCHLPTGGLSAPSLSTGALMHHPNRFPAPPSRAERASLTGLGTSWLYAPSHVSTWPPRAQVAPYMYDHKCLRPITNSVPSPWRAGTGCSRYLLSLGFFSRLSAFLTSRTSWHPRCSSCSCRISGRFCS